MRCACGRVTMLAQADWNKKIPAMPASHGMRAKFEPP